MGDEEHITRHLFHEFFVTHFVGKRTLIIILAGLMLLWSAL